MKFKIRFKTLAFVILNTIIMNSTAQTLGRGLATTPDGQGIVDVAITMKGRPTYISDKDGNFSFAAITDDDGFIIERVEKPGSRVVAPLLPYASTNEGWVVNIVMECEESEQQRAVREYGERLYAQAMELERQKLYGDAADSLVKRANLDEKNVRWQYETGEYMHKYRDYRSAQTYYNRAIEPAKELYGEKNELLATCYEAYGDNYRDWKVWGEESKMNFADAKTYYQIAGNYWVSLYGPVCKGAARIYYKMAICWKNLENDSSAEICLNKALQTLDSDPEKDLPLYALVYFGYVGLYYPAGKYEESLQYLQKLLAVEKELYGEESEYYQRVVRYIDLVRRRMQGE